MNKNSVFQVSDGDSLWMWARETLVPGLYGTEWYNGKKAQEGFIANMEDYLVGVPRIRLARVEKGRETELPSLHYPAVACIIIQYYLG